MNRIVLTVVVLLAGSGAFLAGRSAGDDVLPARVLARSQPASPVLLPDPRLLAGSARIELERLAPSVWASLAPGAAAQQAGALLAAPLPPVKAATSSWQMPGGRAAQAALPAPAPTEQETPAEIASALNKSITAIVRSNGSVRLVLADRATTVRRSLVVGDVFQAGWKLSRIEQGAVTLTKQGRSIHVPIAYSVSAARLPVAGLAGGRAAQSEANYQTASRPSTGPARRRVSRRDAAEN